MMLINVNSADLQIIIFKNYIMGLSSKYTRKIIVCGWCPFYAKWYLTLTLIIIYNSLNDAQENILWQPVDSPLHMKCLYADSSNNRRAKTFLP